MRCFVAIDIDDALRERITSATQKLRLSSRGIKWVEPRLLHITLKFLGEVEDNRVSAADRALAETAASHDPFTLCFCGCGVFPGMKDPRVLWIGLKPAAELAAVFSEIEERFGLIGFGREKRRFSPHLTIGRVRENDGDMMDLTEFLRMKDEHFGDVRVHEILLMKSVLKPSGPEYSRIFSHPFGSSVIKRETEREATG